MVWLIYLFRITFALFSIFMIVFGVFSVAEKEKRAAVISFCFGVFLTGILVFSFSVGESLQNIFGIIFLFCYVILLVLFIYPGPEGNPISSIPVSRFDERDIMFSRARLKENSAEYAAYYELRPENKNIDDALRAAPGLLSDKARFYHPLLFAASKGNFFLTEALHLAVEGEVSEIRQEIQREKVTPYIKGLVETMGAKHVGVTECNPAHYYSHIGRGSGVYGDEIRIDHTAAIVFTVEMDYEMIGANPLAPGVIESSRQYVEAAKIAVTLAATIRELGYEARAHIDGNYRVIAPLVARDAGLGEIGRMGLLITPDLGPRVRIGVVTTNLPLVVDEKIVEPSVIDFCSICRKCVVNCPGKAIPDGERTLQKGVLRWQINSESCFGYWVQCGTDCGRCMTVCPYAHKNNFVHALIRWGIRKSYFFRRFAVLMDDLLYGRKPHRRKPPKWIDSSW